VHISLNQHGVCPVPPRLRKGRQLMLADGLLSMQREGVAPVFEKISAGLCSS